MVKLLEKIEEYLFYGFAFLLPLFVFPAFINPFVTGKLFLVVAFIIVFLSLRILALYTQGKLPYSVSNLDKYVLFLSLVYLLSGLFKTPNKMEAFFLPGIASFFVLGGIVFFLFNQVSKKVRQNLSFVLVFSGVFLSLSVLSSQTTLLAKIPNLPSFMASKDFAPTGTVLETVIYLFAILTVSLFSTFKERALRKKALFASASLIITAALLFSFKSDALKNTKVLPFSPSWVITFETLKDSPFLGSGPGNYLSSFNRFRPIGFNTTPLWNTKFTASRNLYLTIVTETGFLGLAVLAFFLKRAYKLVKKGLSKKVEEKATFTPLVLILTTAFFFPVGTSVLFLLFILLSLSSQTKERVLVFGAKAGKGGLKNLVTIAFVGLVAVFSYFPARAFAAENTFKKTLEGINENNVQKTVSLITKTINLNPYVDRYRTTNAQISLAIAQNLAQKEEITETDRAAITNLITQSVNEAKAAVALNRLRAGNWELLAKVYQSLISFAEGANTFTIQGFVRAIALDPTNVDLRVALGGIYFATGDFENAVDTFRLATLLKPDHANAHYNLALAYKKEGKTENAKKELLVVLSLLNKESNDYLLAQEELNNLESAVVEEPEEPSEEIEVGAEELNPPQPLEEPAIEPPLELPEEATPPQN